MIFIIPISRSFINSLSYLKDIDSKQKDNIILYIGSVIFPYCFNELRSTDSFFSEETFYQISYYLFRNKKLKNKHGDGVDYYFKNTSNLQFKKTYNSIKTYFDVIKGKEIEFVELRHAGSFVYRVKEDEIDKRIEDTEDNLY